jgi:hypothetical protein
MWISPVGSLADPAVRARLVEFGGEIFPCGQQTPEALGALVKADAEKWWPIINELGIKAESRNGDVKAKRSRNAFCQKRLRLLICRVQD